VTHWSGDHTGSERLLRSILERLPGAPMPRQFMALALLAQGGRGAEIAALLEQANPPAPFANSNLARAYVQTGRHAAARESIARLEARGQAGYSVSYDIALIHAELGEPERSLEALAKAHDDRSVGLLYAHNESLFAGLRADPRFAAAVARVRFG
jgi:tetratricopeptide (TPR) repeat protein